jgi:nicotinamide riboside kinase/4'-phosphopantetheinyl transferase EntD
LNFALFMDWNGKSTKKVQHRGAENAGKRLPFSVQPLTAAFPSPSILSLADHKRYASFSNETRRSHFLAARYALEDIRPGLAAEIQYDGDRPFVKEGYLSLSHGGQHACAVFHRYFAVGVDVEGPRPQLQRIAGKFLHPEERTFLEEASSDWGLRIAWGAKEAVYKAAKTPGLAFAEDIRIVQWPCLDRNDPAIDPMLVRLTDGRRFILWVDALPRADGEVDCVVTAMEQPTHARVVLTGPESSGKSTLAQDLSEAFSRPFAAEAARAYLAEQPFRGMEDLLAIHRAQRQASEDLIYRSSEGTRDFVSAAIEDTDALTIWIWAEEKFGEVPEEIQADFAQYPPMLYLLCHPEIPWEPDPLRENPTDRDRLFDRHIALLEAHGHAFVVLRGGRSERLTQALRVLRGWGLGS